MNIPKVILCGNSGVGKTTLLRSISFQKPSIHESPTTGSGFSNCKLDYNGEKIIVNIWDTAGQETYRSMIRIYFYHANLAILVFDMEFKDSFADIKSWIDLIDENSAGSRPSLLLVASKSDIEKPELSEQEIQEVADKYGVKWIKVSAWKNFNIDLLRKSVAEIIVHKKTDPNYSVYRLPNSSNNQSSGNDGSSTNLESNGSGINTPDNNEETETHNDHDFVDLRFPENSFRNECC